MTLLHAMLLAYVPFAWWVWTEYQRQVREAEKTH